MLPESRIDRKLIRCPTCFGRCEINIPVANNTSNSYIFDYTYSGSLSSYKECMKCPTCNGKGEIVEIINIHYEKIGGK